MTCIPAAMPNKKPSNPPDTSSDLRARAEEQLKQINLSTGLSGLSTSPSLDDLLRINHELSVHQIELDMQQEELVQSRKELEESRDRYTELYENAPLGYLTLARDSTILKANLTAAKLLGVYRSILQDKPLTAFVVPVDHRVIDALLEKVFRERVPGFCEVTFVTDPFQPQPLAGKTVRIDAAVSETDYTCRVIFSDITEQKKTENELRHSERNFRALTEQIAELYFIADSLGIITYVSPVAEKMAGYLPEESVGHSFIEYLADDEIPAAMKVFHDTLANKIPKQVVEYKMKKKDGSIFDAEIHLQYYQDEDQCGFIGLIWDITERKQAQLKEQEMAERYEATIEAAQIGTWDWNVQTGEVILNNRWFEILGYTREELAPVSIQIWQALAHPDDFSESMAITEKLGNGTLEFYEREFRMKHKNGQWVWVMDRGKLMTRTADGKPLRMLGTHIDITVHKQAEQALKISENKFRSITEQMAELVFVSDSDGTLMYISPAAEHLFGYLPHEMVGHSFTEYLPEEELSKALSLYNETLTGHLQTQTVEFRLKRKNASFFVGEIHYQYYKDNETTGMIGLIHDVTERNQQEILKNQYEQKLKENEQFLLSIYQEVNHSIFVADVLPDGTYRYQGHNAMNAKLTGISNDKVIGKTPEQVFEPEIAKAITSNYDACIRAGHTLQFIESMPFFGNQMWWETTLNPLFDNDGHIHRIIGTTTNITDRRLAEIKLETLLHDLMEAKEKAEESDRLKSAFMANISHEIRTPMNGILGFTELLKDPQLTGEEQTEFITLIHKSGERMLNLINDLIDISRIDAREATLQITKTPVNELLHDLQAFFKPESDKRGLRLTSTAGLPDNESYITTDSVKLNQILTNLIQNALKFTTKGGIDFGYTRKDNNLEFYVIDSGIGIPRNKKEKIFERFHQVNDSLTRDHEGAGLGLSITKAFVEMLGGTIRVESSEGAGSNFTFTVPYNSVSSPKSSTPVTPHAVDAPQAFTILIAEDDDLSTILLKKTLKQENITILSAENGWEAVELVRHHPEINLVLMDLKMPIMNGFEATKIIKHERPDLPVIAQSAFTSKEDKANAKEAGADSFITKPINKTELLDMVTTFLKR